ncbi:MAG: hypothetical protein K2Y23_03045 [Cyanobacteria bacterium]|nr:hypothetical protein [Cyanobacteriota bacterium]
MTAEIALALTVPCGAGLLGRSVMELQNVKPGFTAASALSLRVTLPQRSYRDSNAQHIFYTRVIDGLKSAPQPPPNERPVVDARPVTPGYFTAMQIPMLAGRDVNDAGTEDKFRWR